MHTTEHGVHAYLRNEDSIRLAPCAVETYYKITWDTPSSVEEVANHWKQTV